MFTPRVRSKLRFAWFASLVMMLAGSLASPASAAAGDDPGDGKIVTGDAGADGSLKIKIRCRQANGTVETIELTVQINVANHDTDGSGVVEADEKAEEIENRIDLLNPACFDAQVGLIPDRVTLDANAGCEIIELEVNDDTTQELIGTKVTPVPPKEAKGKACFEGTPQGGQAGVDVGPVSSSVNTTGMTANGIMNALASQLSLQGVDAAVIGQAIWINDDLSNDLLTANNTDPGLSLCVGVYAASSGTIPALSEWGLFILVLLFLAGGAVLMLRLR